jgi:hypothetical protein
VWEWTVYERSISLTFDILLTKIIYAKVNNYFLSRYSDLIVNLLSSVTSVITFTNNKEEIGRISAVALHDDKIVHLGGYLSASHAISFYSATN